VSGDDKGVCGDDLGVQVDRLLGECTATYHVDLFVSGSEAIGGLRGWVDGNMKW
jgi:hypothetical protein